MNEDRGEHEGEGLCTISDKGSEGLREPFFDQPKLDGKEMGEARLALAREGLWAETPAVLDRGEAEASPELCLEAL